MQESKTSSIRRCTCDHKFQDKRYGKGMRVHAIMANTNQRCTVCGSVKGAAR